MRSLGRGPTRGDKFLDGTAITGANPQGEISYCDMAVNLDRAAREGITPPPLIPERLTRAGLLIPAAVL